MTAGFRQGSIEGGVWRCLLLILAAAALAAPACAQAPAARTGSRPEQDLPGGSEKTIQDYNLELQNLQKTLTTDVPFQAGMDYRIGPDDLLEIAVFGAQEFSGTTRVSASGDISVPLLGVVHAGGLTPHEVELRIAELLRRTYMKDPHVSVFVKEMQSHPVSVFGAVKKPGVIQIRGPKTVIEVLCLAEGLADDAGSSIVVTHHGELTGATPSSADPPGAGQNDEAAGVSGVGREQVNLQDLVESGDTRLNVLVYPGDSVSVSRAGIIYVVGEVKKPGGFQLRANEKVTVLQALALAEGFTRTAAKESARVMRTDAKTDGRVEIPVDLGKVLSGKVPDPQLQARDILFVPNSKGRSALQRGLETAIAVGSGLAIYRF